MKANNHFSNINSNVTIRESQEKDIDRVVEIAIEAYKPIYDGFRTALGDTIYFYEYPDFKKAKASQIYESYKAESGYKVFVTVINDKIVGFITFKLDKLKHVGVIGNNAVDPKFQGKGIAGFMYSYVINEMKEQGMKYVKVGTGGDQAHAPARKAYEKIGFKKCIPRVDYYMEI